MNRRKSFKEWLIATRPWSFPASSMPVIVTFAYLYTNSNISIESLNWVNALLVFGCMVLFQASGNVLNDFFDYKKGVDREGVICTPSIVSGLFSQREILTLGLVLLCLSSIMGIILWLRTDAVTLYLGLAALFSALCYSWLKFKALGDYLIFLVYALFPMLGTVYVMTGEFLWSIVFLSLPIGLITVGILHANNTRDRQNDEKAGIKTLSLQIGLKRSIQLYQFEIFFPFLWLAGCVCFRVLPLLSLLAILAFPIAWRNSKMMIKATNDGSSIERLDENTAQLQLIFSVLLSLGFCLQRIFF